MKFQEDVFVVLDDMSRYGLRRLHLLGAFPVDADPYLDQMEAIGGIPLVKMEYEDDLGNYHLYLAWRFVMEAMVVFGIDGCDLGEAIGKAAVGYFRRFGVWPDWGVIRGTGDAKNASLDGGCKERILGRETGKGEIKNLEFKRDGEVVGEVRIERVGWMRAGDVGVYKKAAN